MYQSKLVSFIQIFILIIRQVRIQFKYLLISASDFLFKL